MAGIKIHQYPLERFTFGDDDYYDIDYWDGAGYQTAKIKGSVLKAALAANLFTDDLTLSASRNHNLNSQQFKMRNGALQFGEVGAGLISSFLVESSNFDVRTANPLGDHTSLNIGGSGGTIQNISAGGSNIGKIQITGPTLSGVFTSGGVGPVVSANPSLYSVVNEDPGTGDKTTILQTHTDITQLSEDATRSTRIYQTKDILQIANFLSVGGGDQITLRWDNTLNNLVIEDNRTTKTGIEYYADYSGSFTARSLVDKGYVDANAGASELNDLTDVNTGLPVSPTEADDGKLLFYDFDAGEWITDDSVTHGTVIINGKKSTAGTIAKGTPVYLVGFDADLHTVEVADASSSATMPIIGLAAESMDDTNSKHITTFGKLTGVDTTATSALNPNGETWAVNDALYMSTTAGGFTKVRPTGGTTEIQRVAKVLKVDAAGGQLFVFNTARTAGLPNLGTDKLWIGDANGIPQEVDKSTIGASIYTQDDTIGSGRVATLTDSLTFDGGNLIKKGSDTSVATSNFKLIDSAGADLWDWRNNGDVHLGKTSTLYTVGNNLLTFDFTSNGSTGAFSILSKNILPPTYLDPYIKVNEYGGIKVLSNQTASGAYEAIDCITGSRFFNVGVRYNTSTNLWDAAGIKIGAVSVNDYVYYNEGKFQFFANSTELHEIDHRAINNNVHFFKGGAGKFLVDTTNNIILGGSAIVGTEKISLQGRTLVQGTDTLSTSTAFEIYDGDTVPSQLLSIRNNGKFILDTSKAYDAEPFLVQGIPFGGTGTKPYLKVKGYGEVEVLGRLTDLFTVKNGLGNPILDVNDGGVNINGTTTITSSYFQVKTTSRAMDFYTSAGGSLAHDIQTGIGFPDKVRFNILGSTRQFIVGGSAIIGSETISLQGSTLINGTLDMNNNRITKTIVNPTVQETTSTATLTINANQENTGVLTAQAVALTVANPTGTAVQGQKLVYRIKDNGTGRAITWGANFRAIGVTLPTTTTASKLLYVGCIYNTTDSKWDVIAVNEEA